MLLPHHENRPVPELTPVHKAYKLALSQEPVTVKEDEIDARKR
jgi:hypothetical protein